MRWLLILSSVALAAAARSHALDCTASAIAGAPSYVPCQAVTKIDFSVNGKTTLLDPSVFCGNTDCKALWGLLQRLNALQCLQRYNSGSYVLKDPVSAQSCFNTYSSPASTAKPEAPASANPSTSTPTPQLTTTTTPQGESSISAHETSDSAGTTTATTSTISSTATALSSSSSPSPKASTTTTSANVGVTKFQLSDTMTVKAAESTATAGSGRGEASVESAVIGAVGTNSSASSPKPATPDSSTTNKAESDLQGTSRSAVYITLASCGGGVVLLIMLSIFIRRRKARKLEAKMRECLDQTGRGDYVPTMHSARSRQAAKNDSVSSSLSTLRTRPSPKLVCLDDDIITAVRIPYGKLTLNSLVSRGGFGEVYRGMYRSKVVAIKRLLPEKRNDVYQIETFLDEVKLMASLEHEHIVRFVGVAWDTVEELCVVSEFMALGDLRTLLAKYDLNEDAHPKGFSVDKLKIALHVAKALTYMHSLDPVVLHRDIKSRNILLDVNLDAKVTDFGVSRERTESTMTTGVGSTLWMAPEVMAGGRYNEKADVFSFGVVLSELDTHTIPYSHVVEPGRGRRLPDTVIVQMMMMNRISVQFTKETESPMAELGRRCIHLDPSKRPSAKEVEEFIEAQWRSIVVAL